MELIDLRIGNPDIIIELLSASHSKKSVESSIYEGMPYQKEGPYQETVNKIIQLHEKFHPKLLNKDSKIVVGSGASQIISSIFSINNNICVPKPFWFRTPILAEKNKSKIQEYKYYNSNSFNLITYPNNPCGSLILSSSKNSFYDSVYLWPWYFNTDSEYNNAIEKLCDTQKIATIFSLSKMSGHCGVRFGWAVVEDNSIYEKICEYMEFESGGLGYDTQKKACSIIDTLLNNSDWNDILSNIQKILYSRKLFISDLCEKNGWVYYKKPGMFAWISTKGNSLEELKNIGILGTCGSKCGGSTNQVRINLAVDTKTWDSLTEIFKNSL